MFGFGFLLVGLVCVSVSTLPPIPACLLRFSRSSDLGALLHFNMVQLDSANQDVIYVELLNSPGVAIPLLL